MTELARASEVAENTPILHVVFSIAKGEYVLPTEVVVQIESFSEATPVPGAPAFVIGIVQIRGRVIPLIDLRLRFGEARLPATPDTRIVVGQHGERLVGLLVDQARDVMKIPPGALKPPPRILDEQSGGFVSAVAQVGTRLVMLIDFAKVIGEEIVDGD